MRKQLERRLLQLKAKRDTGQQQLIQVEQSAANLRATLMRMSGAIQVLEEELAQDDKSNDEQAA